MALLLRCTECYEKERGHPPGPRIVSARNGICEACSRVVDKLYRDECCKDYPFCECEDSGGDAGTAALKPLENVEADKAPADDKVEWSELQREWRKTDADEVALRIYLQFLGSKQGTLYEGAGEATREQQDLIMRKAFEKAKRFMAMSREE